MEKMHYDIKELSDNELIDINGGSVIALLVGLIIGIGIGIGIATSEDIVDK